MSLGDLYPAVLTLVLIGIVLGVGLIVLDEFLDETTAGSTAYTAVNDTITAIAEFPDWLEIIVIVIAAGIILAIVFRSLGGMRGGM